MFDAVFLNRGLSLERLKTLVDVQEAGGIAGAAPDSSSRQSQYSRQLRELSEFFGTEIAERDGKGIRLTEFGEKVAGAARRSFAAMEDLLAESRMASRQFRIVAGESVLQWLVAPRLAPLALGQARASFAMVNVRTADAIHRVQEGRADFGVVRQDAVPRGLKSASLGCLRFKAVTPRRLAPKSPPTLAQLFELPLAILTTDGQFTSRVREIARRHHHVLNAALACQSFAQVASAVRSGNYAGIVPTIGAQEFSNNEFHLLQPEPFKVLVRELMLIWNQRTISVRAGADQTINFLRRSLFLR